MYLQMKLASAVSEETAEVVQAAIPNGQPVDELIPQNRIAVDIEVAQGRPVLHTSLGRRGQAMTCAVLPLGKLNWMKA